MEHTRIQCSREEVVRRSHGVDIARKVQIELKMTSQRSSPIIRHDY